MNAKSLVKPTPQQVAWADCEIGVIIHMDVQVFEPSYQFREQRGYTPSPDIVNPRDLDTDQWLEAANALGAKYAVLVAKHCSGFSLWPTDAHDYGIASSPWRGGKGDIVGDFFASCERLGIRPGLYYSAACNAYLNVDNPGLVLSRDEEEQERYNEVVVQQLTELWTRYGDIFEIWFDGGLVPPEHGGPEIVPLLEKYQPEAVVFQGPPGFPSLIRWSGNERGEAPYPCWSTANTFSPHEQGYVPAGSPDGGVWAPAESDIPNRDQHKAYMGGWFWREGDDQYLYSVEHLLERYYTSVGRNTNYLIGMVIDQHGLVPEADSAQFEGAGKAIRRAFENRVAKTSGEGPHLEIQFDQPREVAQTIIMEDIREGERIRGYVIEGLTGQGWQSLTFGISVGHKRIDRFDPVAIKGIRLRCDEYVARPKIREFSVFGAFLEDR